MKTATSIIILVLLCLFFPLALLLTQIEQYVLEPTPLLRTLQEEQVSVELPRLVATELVQRNILPAALAVLDIPTLLQAVFPPAWLDAQLATLVPEMYRLLEPRTDLEETNLRLELSEPKQRSKEQLAIVLPNLLEHLNSDVTLPLCTENDMMNFFGAADSFDFDGLRDLRCRPNVNVQSRLSSAFGVVEDTLMSTIPNEVDFAPALAAAVTHRSWEMGEETRNISAFAEANAKLQVLQQWHSALRILLVALWTLIGLLTLLLLLLHARPWHRFVMWGSSVLLVPAVLALVLFVGMQYTLQQLLQRALRDATLTSDVQAMIVDVVQNYAQNFFVPLDGVVVFSLGLSAVGFVISAVFARRGSSHSFDSSRKRR